MKSSSQVFFVFASSSSDIQSHIRNVDDSKHGLYGVLGRFRDTYIDKAAVQTSEANTLVS
jgi:hypothetical protein